MDGTTLGKRLKRLRQAHGLTQIEAAARMGFSDSSIVAKTEAGNRTVSAIEFVRWCGIYNTTPDAVTRGDAITVAIADPPSPVEEEAS